MSLMNYLTDPLKKEKPDYKNIDGFTSLINKYGEKLLENNIPILGVFGLGEKCGKSKLVRETKLEMENRGYKVTYMVNENIQSDNMGYTFPTELFSSKLSDQHQIIIFNQIIYEVCKCTKPDIFIVEIPQGILPLSDDLTNDFGVTAYKIANAINIDIGVLNVYADIDSVDFLSEMYKIFLYRFSIDEVYFGIYSKKLDWPAIIAEKRFKFMNAEEHEIKRIKKELVEKNAFILQERNDIKSLIDDIERSMVNNAVVDIL